MKKQHDYNLNDKNDKMMMSELVGYIREKVDELTQDDEEAEPTITWEEYKEMFSYENRFKHLQEFEEQLASGHVDAIPLDEFVAQFKKKHPWFTISRANAGGLSSKIS